MGSDSKVMVVWVKLGDAADGSRLVVLVNEARPTPGQIPFSDGRRVSLTAQPRRKTNTRDLMSPRSGQA